MTLLAAVECQLQRPDAVTRSRAHLAVLGFWTLLPGSRVGFRTGAVWDLFKTIGASLRDLLPRGFCYYDSGLR